jgi:hypothetical protein
MRAGHPRENGPPIHPGGPSRMQREGGQPPHEEVWSETCAGLASGACVTRAPNVRAADWSARPQTMLRDFRPPRAEAVRLLRPALRIDRCAKRNSARATASGSIGRIGGIGRFGREKFGVSRCVCTHSGRRVSHVARRGRRLHKCSRSRTDGKRDNCCGEGLVHCVLHFPLRYLEFSAGAGRK